MRILITRQLHENIDGIQLSALRPHYVYSVGSTIGNYLLAVGAGKPVAEDEPYIVRSREKQLFLRELNSGTTVAET
jgi:hypothetical protein